MPFSIGISELLTTLLVALPTIALYCRRDSRYRWSFAALVCATLAMVITPADLLSMLVLFAAFLGVFIFGMRYRPSPISDVGPKQA